MFQNNNTQNLFQNQNQQQQQQGNNIFQNNNQQAGQQQQNNVFQNNNQQQQGGNNLFQNQGQQQQQGNNIFQNQGQQQQQGNNLFQNQGQQQGNNMFQNQGQQQQNNNLFQNQQGQQQNTAQFGGFANQQQQQMQGNNNNQMFNNMVPNNQNIFQNNQQQQQQQQGGIFGQQQQQQNQQFLQLQFNEQGKSHRDHSLAYFSLATDGLHAEIKNIFEKPVYQQSKNEFLQKKGVQASTYYMLNNNNQYAIKKLSEVIEQSKSQQPQQQPQGTLAMGNQNKHSLDYSLILKKMTQVQRIINRNKNFQNQDKNQSDLEQLSQIVSNTIYNLDMRGNNTNPQMMQQQQLPYNFFKAQLATNFHNEMRQRCQNLILDKNNDISLQGIKHNFIKLNEDRNQIIRLAEEQIGKFKNKSITQSNTWNNILILYRNNEFNKQMQQDSTLALQNYFHSAQIQREIPNPFIVYLMDNIYNNDIQQLEKRIEELDIITDVQEQQQEDQQSQNDNDIVNMIESIESLQDYFKILMGNSQELHRDIEKKLETLGFNQRPITYQDKYSQQKMDTTKTNQRLFVQIKDCEQNIEKLKSCMARSGKNQEQVHRLYTVSKIYNKPSVQ